MRRLGKMARAHKMLTAPPARSSQGDPLHRLERLADCHRFPTYIRMSTCSSIYMHNFTFTIYIYIYIYIYTCITCIIYIICIYTYILYVYTHMYVYNILVRIRKTDPPSGALDQQRLFRVCREAAIMGFETLTSRSRTLRLWRLTLHPWIPLHTLTCTCKTPIHIHISLTQP